MSSTDNEITTTTTIEVTDTEPVEKPKTPEQCEAEKPEMSVPSEQQNQEVSESSDKPKSPEPVDATNNPKTQDPSEFTDKPKTPEPTDKAKTPEPSELTANDKPKTPEPTYKPKTPEPSETIDKPKTPEPVQETQENTPIEAVKSDQVDAPIEDPTERAVPNETSESSSIKDVDAAVEELLQDKELEARQKTPTDERSKDVDTTDGPINPENRSNEVEPESRGEDRSDAPKNETEGRGDEGVDDGVAASNSTSQDNKSQEEAMTSLIDDKNILEKELQATKLKLDELQNNVAKMESEVETVNTSRKEQDSYIKSLETDISKLKEYEDWGKNNEQKVQEVQNKLSSLSEAEEAKNKLIADLEKTLKETQENLSKAEAKIEEQEASGNRADSNEQKTSRTCTIM